MPSRSSLFAAGRQAHTSPMVSFESVWSCPAFQTGRPVCCCASRCPLPLCQPASLPFGLGLPAGIQSASMLNPVQPAPPQPQLPSRACNHQLASGGHRLISSGPPPTSGPRRYDLHHAILLHGGYTAASELLGRPPAWPPHRHLQRWAGQRGAICRTYFQAQLGVGTRAARPLFPSRNGRAPAAMPASRHQAALTGLSAPASCRSPVPFLA